jgi:hypothetical protein
MDVQENSKERTERPFGILSEGSTEVRFQALPEMVGVVLPVILQYSVKR